MSANSDHTRLKQRAIREATDVIIVTAYFFVWFAVLMTLKKVILEDYHVRFRGLTLAAIGALIVAKVVIVLEHLPFGPWVRRHASAIAVVLRTTLEAAAAFGVLLLEKAFEVRHEFGGFRTALLNIFHHRDMPHVWANLIGIGTALLAYDGMSIVRRHLGDRKLIGIFLIPLPESLHGGDGKRG